MLRRLLAVSAGVLAVAATAGAAPLPSLSDTFDNPATGATWQVIQGDYPDGDSTTFDIAKTTPGELTIVPGRSWWVDQTRGFYLYKPVTGDFMASLRLRVTGRDGTVPTANWSLSGLLIRRPVADRAQESWVSFRIGRVNNVDVFERKSTNHGRSALILTPTKPGWVELRVARVGQYFALLYRYPGGAWRFHYAYWRPDLPQTLTVGIDSFSGDNDTKADLVSHVDSLLFASTGVPGPLKKQVLAGKKPASLLLRYLTR
jgi:hypothetical protein